MNALIDFNVWMFLQLYFLPYRLPQYGSEVDKWISVVSLNGAKGNICKPNQPLPAAASLSSSVLA